MKRILSYLLVCIFLLPISSPLYAQPTESAALTDAKKTVAKHVKALLHCLQRKECTPEAYKAAAIAISALLPLVIGIGATIGLVVKTRKPKEEEEVSLERKHKPTQPSEFQGGAEQEELAEAEEIEPTEQWSEFQGAESELVEFGPFQGAQEGQTSF